MSESNVPVGQSVEPVAPAEKDQRETVNYETHRKLLDEKKKIQAKLDEILAKEKEREESEARKRGDFEALLKARNEELERERKAREELESRIIQGRKLNAVIEALGGNVEPKWLKLIDVSEVAVNPETGEIDQLTVARQAETLKRDWPEMVRVAGKLPHQAPKGLEGGGGMITESEWKKLGSVKEMNKYRRDQIIWDK